MKLAVVQNPSIFLDKRATIELAVALVEQAASDGAELVIFTEAFIPGYPAWVWRLRPGGDWVCRSNFTNFCCVTQFSWHLMTLNRSTPPPENIN